MKRASLVLIFAFFVVGSTPAQEQPYVAPTDPAVQKKLEWWGDLKFGLLMHWGPYSQWGIVESWSLVTTRHPWNNRPAP